MGSTVKRTLFGAIWTLGAGMIGLCALASCSLVFSSSSVEGDRDASNTDPSQDAQRDGADALSDATLPGDGSIVGPDAALPPPGTACDSNIGFTAARDSATFIASQSPQYRVLADGEGELPLGFDGQGNQVTTYLSFRPLEINTEMVTRVVLILESFNPVDSSVGLELEVQIASTLDDPPLTEARPAALSPILLPLFSEPPNNLWGKDTTHYSLDISDGVLGVMENTNWIAGESQFFLVITAKGGTPSGNRRVIYSSETTTNNKPIVDFCIL